MNVYDIVESLAGEIVNNKAKVMVDGKWVVIARMIGQAFELTAEGDEMAVAMESRAAEKPATKPKGKGKAKAEAPAEVPDDIDFNLDESE